MAKRKAGRRSQGSQRAKGSKGPKRMNTARKAAPAKRGTKRPGAGGTGRRKPVARKRAPARGKVLPPRAARLDRERRRLEESVPTPPSSLDMDRHGSAVRTGRAEIAQARQAHATMTPEITGGDVDANVESAYFSGDEAPGGDNSTPDQDIVDEIGKALGLQYQDAEELGGEKIAGRDKHRWELDPASADDYKDRKNS
ncbi:MAG: hypothetical protein A3H97_05850 [Acidobacteria bacterium RIFCSPLOWO2_02_FULL_65_29]|nr:MAG: hypothetical protein A3H97_05850 [Acidobacteria bacterium RIFCSPLOWO2_02_FULL_65_29]